MKKHRWGIVFVFSILVGGLLPLFASSFPDGLKKVAETQGFLGKEIQIFSGFIPQYQFSGIYRSDLSISLSGIIGTVIVFTFLFFVGKLLYRSKTVKNTNK